MPLRYIKEVKVSIPNTTTKQPLCHSKYHRRLEMHFKYFYLTCFCYHYLIDVKNCYLLKTMISREKFISKKPIFQIGYEKKKIMEVDSKYVMCCMIMNLNEKNTIFKTP